MNKAALKSKLRGLVQYKNLTEIELGEIVSKKIEEEDLSIESQFIDHKEKKVAKDLLSKYLDDYSINTISDRNTLKQLIYLEIMGFRMQGIANDLHTKEKVVPIQLMNTIHANINEILSLKDKLGIGKTNKETDSFQYIDLLKKKFKLWQEENQGSRTMVCPHCGKMVLLRIRMDAWESQKHPYFKDRVLRNEHLVRLYQSDRLTKEDLSKILECSTNYVDWLCKRWGDNEKK